MPRLKPEKAAELEAFWRFHHEGWARSALNQREYCEAHGLPLKRFGNWRDKFRNQEAIVQKGLLYRRGGGLSHMSSHMTDRDFSNTSTGYIPSALATPEVRRNFRLSDKKRMVAEASRPDMSVSAVARRYGVAPRLLFRWKRELSEPEQGSVFLPVTIDDRTADTAGPHVARGPTPELPGKPRVAERRPQDLEVELSGGQRLRFAWDTDPVTVREMIDVLEGGTS
ncbi:MAG: transposase [Roseitalea porphyridii]